MLSNISGKNSQKKNLFEKIWDPFINFKDLDMPAGMDFWDAENKSSYTVVTNLLYNAHLAL